MEIWKDVILYSLQNTDFEVSNNGKVRNKTTKVNRPIRNRNGYDCCTISYKQFNKTVYKTCNIHRLVATAFIPNPNKLPEINHKDRNSRNNNVSNLEWCDRSYNVNYDGSRERSRITQQRPITCIFNNKKATYISAHKAAELCNCHWCSIAEVVRGDKKKFIWFLLESCYTS